MKGGDNFVEVPRKNKNIPDDVRIILPEGGQKRGNMRLNIAQIAGIYCINLLRAAEYVFAGVKLMPWPSGEE
jgi:hypothetical protein